MFVSIDGRSVDESVAADFDGGVDRRLDVHFATYLERAESDAGYGDAVWQNKVTPTHHRKRSHRLNLKEERETSVTLMWCWAAVLLTVHETNSSA